MKEKIIFFTTCKPFEGDDAWRQEQALKSWMDLKVDKKILVMGNDKGVKEICEKYNLIHIPEIRNLDGVPYVYSMYEKAWEYGNEKDFFIWTNCDMIYFDDMVKSIEKFKIRRDNQNIKNFILVGQRHDWYEPRVLENFDKNKLLKNEKNNLKLHGTNGIDYVIHNKEIYKGIYPKNLVIAGMRHDMVMVGMAIQKNFYTFNATNNIFALHQEHNKDNGRNIIKKLVNNNSSLGRLPMMGIDKCKYKL